MHCADQLAARSAANEVILLTHTKDQLKFTSLASALGDALAKALGNGSAVSLPSGANLRHATKQTVSPWLRNVVVVVAYGEARILDFVDGLTGAAGVVVVPDLPNSANHWIERWNPTVLGQEPQPAATLIADRIVEVALETITKMSNLSHAVMNPRDKEFAKEVLRILKAKGHTLEPERICTWAIREGWQPKAAQELANVAQKVANLKARPSLSGIHDPNGRYDRWKAEAAGE